MFIIGWRQTVRELAALVMVCSVCGIRGWHRIHRRLFWITLFFVPVLPTWVSRSTLCCTCGAQRKMRGSEADALMAQATRTAT